MADFVIKAKAQDINFVNKFETDLHNLLAILGKEEIETLAPGAVLKTYPTSGTLSTEEVGEKEEIPDSAIGMGDATLIEVTWSKYRNLVAMEQIAKKGYEVAVGGANTSLRKQMYKKIRATIVGALAVSGASTGTASTFQKKVAKCAELLQVKYEDEACTPVFFANPTDVFDYLGDSTITLQTAFGLSYLQNFMGIGNVIVDSNVPSGTVYGTASENLVIANADVSAIGEFDMTTDETGLIAVHNGVEYKNASLETVAYSGIQASAYIADRVVIVTSA